MSEYLKDRALFDDAVSCSSPAALWWLGQHSFLVKIADVRFLIDPFLSEVDGRRVPPLFRVDDASGIVDLVLCTHDHLDHIDPVAVTGLASSTEAHFVAPGAHQARMHGLGVPPDRLHVLNDGESVALRDLEIHAVRSAHERFDETEEGLYPYLGYVIQGRGKTLYHAGDTVWWEGLQNRLSRWSFDAALVPINGRDATRYRENVMGNMTYQEAADLLGGLDVRLSVPTHYDMFEFNAEDPNLFVEYMTVKYPDHKVWAGTPTKKVVF